MTTPPTQTKGRDPGAPVAHRVVLRQGRATAALVPCAACGGGRHGGGAPWVDAPFPGWCGCYCHEAAVASVSQTDPAL